MTQVSKIFLVGPMGTGKSTIGRHLAVQLAMDFIDIDDEIQNRTGVDIPTIFHYEGEAGFRKRETRVIADLTLRDNIVLATGGGAVTTPENRDLLKDRGFVIYLHSSPEQQYERTKHSRNRPLIANDAPLESLKKLMEIREPLYRQVADMVISTEASKVPRIIKKIIDHIKEHASPEPGQELET